MLNKFIFNRRKETAFTSMSMCVLMSVNEARKEKGERERGMKERRKRRRGEKRNVDFCPESFV